MCKIVGEIAVGHNLTDIAIKPESEIVAMSPIRIAIYTCITQGYDSLKTPLTIDERLAYFCYTDIPENVKPPWKFLPIDLKGLSPKDQNRYIKMHPHEFLADYDVTVYVDGNIQIVGGVYWLICLALNSQEDIFMFQHPWRNCIYQEAAACARFSHDWIWNIASQMRKYSKAGYPPEHGLFEANVIIRKSSAAVCRLMNKWWREYSLGTRRDQLSLPFAAWQLGIPLGSLGKSDPRFGHRYFRFHDHPPRRSLKLAIRRRINLFISSLFSYQRLFGVMVPTNWK